MIHNLARTLDINEHSKYGLETQTDRLPVSDVRKNVNRKNDNDLIIVLNKTSFQILIYSVAMATNSAIRHQNEIPNMSISAMFLKEHRP